MIISDLVVNFDNLRGVERFTKFHTGRKVLLNGRLLLDPRSQLYIVSRNPAASDGVARVEFCFFPVSSASRGVARPDYFN